MVTGYEPLVQAMTNDPKDRHVLAAAVRADAAVIVTSNLKDFPPASLAPYALSVVSPDDFLLDQLELYPGQTLACLLLQRDDRLAEQCLDTLFAWNGGDDLPHAHVIDIALDGAWGAEFCARLEPATRTAQYLILDRQRQGEAMVDPLTDTPVVVNTAEGTARALAPNRLPATSPLAELILDNPVWVRTADGTLYPAPHDPSYGLSWGYGGTGPTVLALLAGKLLDDITTPGAQLGNESPAPGLLALFRREHKATTVLTRADLEAARNSG